MRIVFLISLVFLAACTPKKADPVPIVKATDVQMTCAEIVAERNAHKAKTSKLLDSQSDTEIKNIIFGAALQDFSRTEKVELMAIHDRNQTLGRLALQKGCNADPGQKS